MIEVTFALMALGGLILTAKLLDWLCLTTIRFFYPLKRSGEPTQ